MDELLNADLRIDLQATVAEHIATLLETIVILNAITDLTNATINTNPAAVIKDLTRAVKAVTRQSLRLSRLVIGAFDNAAVGDDPQL